MSEIKQAPLVSLVVATLGRTLELKELLESIRTSTYKNIEVIIVDQNDGGYLSSVIKPYLSEINIKHHLVEFKGLSRSRNYGCLKAKGDIVNFPDDDSCFERTTIERMVYLHQGEYAHCQALTCKVLDPNTGEVSMLKFLNKTVKVNCHNFFKTMIEFNTFWKKDALPFPVVFNESLGLGEYFSSEESSDLILRCLEQKYNIVYIHDIAVFHLNQKEVANQKVFNYALGFGALFYLHSKKFCVYPYFFHYFIRGLIGLVIFYIRFDIRKQKYSARCRGVVKGYIEARKRLNKSRI